MKELINIQSELKAPKGQFNKFGGYAYRSCEDILEALKPVMAKYGCHLTLTDEITAIGTRIYVKATATLVNMTGECVQASASAREEETKKGMDAAQITGAASSYARKYALNGLFCIDDTKDPDATNKHGNDAPAPAPASSAPAQAQPAVTVDQAIAHLRTATTTEELTAISAMYKQFYKTPAFLKAGKEMRDSLKNPA